jgi:predicted amidohydrolase YtcJ
MQWQIYTNGRIYTADAQRSWAEALATCGNRFIAAGTPEAVRHAVPASTPEFDLGGRTVVPGLIDAHNHFLQTAESLTWADVRFPNVASIAGLVAAIAAAATGTPEGAWIYAFGLDPAKLTDGRTPTRWDLDEATSRHPVLVHHVSGHHALVNSTALRRSAGEDVTDPPGGQFPRDEAGRPNGWCLDAATGVILPVAVDVGNHGPNIHFEASTDRLANALEAGSQAYLAAGLTTVCDAQVTRREFSGYREGLRRGTLGIRVVCMPLSHQLDALLDTGITGPLWDGKLGIGPLKLYADGALTGGTACFTRPYGESGEFPGILYHEPAELTSLVARAQNHGWQVGVHAQGDRAITMTLDAIEAGSGGQAGRRHRIEHAGYPAGELDRIARLGVVLVNQPGYLHDFGDAFLKTLAERAHWLQPLRDELRAGISVVLSSDSFVTTYNPMHHIAAAVNRTTRTGQPIGSDQALTVEEAIRAYTIDAARSFFADDSIGSIEQGKLADFVVLDEDPFTMPSERLGQTKPRMTVLGGQIAYQGSGGQASIT